MTLASNVERPATHVSASAASAAPGAPADGAELRAAIERAEAAERGFKGAMDLLKTTTTSEGQLRARVAELEGKAVADRRDALVKSALREGRITPAQRPHFRRALDIDERGTAEVLAGLAAGQALPLGEVGEIPAPDALSTGVGRFDTSLLTPHQIAELRERGVL